MNDLAFDYKATRQRRGGKGSVYNIPVSTSLAAWYRYRRGIINTNGAVSTWRDLSGNGRDLLQSTAANRPTLLSDGSLSFDGTNDTLAATFTLAQPLTFYILFQQVTWTTGDVILDGVSATVKMGQATASPGIIANAGSALTVDNTAKIGSWAVAAFVANGNSSVYQVGGGAASVTTTGVGGTNAAGGITVGSDRSGANNGNVLVREVIAFSVAHDGPTRLQMLRYLQGVGGSLGGV